MSTQYHGRTAWTPQEIQNLSLDPTVNSPMPMRAGTVFVENVGWIRQPVLGVFPVEQYDWAADGTLTYKGVNTSRSAADGDTDWIIFKHTYDANLRVTKIEMRVTSWTNRTAGW